MFRNCDHEKELTQALKAGHWPDACDSQLRAHVEECSSCTDLVLVTQTFQQARFASTQTMPPYSSGLLWWRAQLRNRNAADRKMGAPITIAQIFAWLVIVLSMAVLVASQYRHGLQWEAWWGELAPSHAWRVAAAAYLNWNFILVAPGFLALLLLSGVVVYLVTAKQ